MLSWVNGTESIQVQSSDRGLAYGDGLFETLLIVGGLPRYVAEHQARMRLGAQRLNLPTDAVNQLFAELAQALSLADLDSQLAYVAKLTLTRGVGGRGYLAPESPEPTRIVNVSELPDWSRRQSLGEAGVTLRWCATQLGHNPALAGLKHLNRLEQVLARNEWQSADIHEGLVCDFEGRVIEATMSNVFWVKDEVLYTPELSLCGVQGVMRDVLLRFFKAQGYTRKEGHFSADHLDDASEVFLTNSINGCWPVTQLGDKPIAIGPFARLAQKFLVEEYSR